VLLKRESNIFGRGRGGGLDWGGRTNGLPRLKLIEGGKGVYFQTEVNFLESLKKGEGAFLRRKKKKKT